MNNLVYGIVEIIEGQDLDFQIEEVDNIIIYEDEIVNIINDSKNTYFISEKKPKYENFIVKKFNIIKLEDIENIISSCNIIKIKGFEFIRKKVYLTKTLVKCSNEDEFQLIASKLNIDGYKYDFYHRQFERNKINNLTNNYYNGVIYNIKKDHPLIITFLDFLKNCFKTKNNRIFTIILIGDTKIGKSICFKNCLIPSNYIEYHNNFLEFSKTDNENKKLFRILDDISWENVDEMSLKSILNRNISTINVKYAYGIVYPLINIVLMNAEDFVIFINKFKSIYNFIQKNTIIYPEFNGKDINEEHERIYDVNSNFNDDYLFNEVFNVDELDDLNITNNIYNAIKDKLVLENPTIYDNNQFLEFEEKEKIDNLNSNKLIKQLKNSISKKSLIKKLKEKTKERNKQNKKYRFNNLIDLDSSYTVTEESKIKKNNYNKKYNKDDDDDDDDDSDDNNYYNDNDFEEEDDDYDNSSITENENSSDSLVKY